MQDHLHPSQHRAFSLRLAVAVLLSHCLHHLGAVDGGGADALAMGGGATGQARREEPVTVHGRPRLRALSPVASPPAPLPCASQPHESCDLSHGRIHASMACNLNLWALSPGHAWQCPELPCPLKLHLMSLLLVPCAWDIELFHAWSPEFLSMPLGTQSFEAARLDEGRGASKARLDVKKKLASLVVEMLLLFVAHTLGRSPGAMSVTPAASCPMPTADSCNRAHARAVLALVLYYVAAAVVDARRVARACSAIPALLALVLASIACQGLLHCSGVCTRYRCLEICTRFGNAVPCLVLVDMRLRFQKTPSVL